MIGITKRKFIILIILLVIILFFYELYKDNLLLDDNGIYEPHSEAVVTESKLVEDLLIEDEIGTVEEVYGDPNNRTYPFNTMSADWGEDLYESGFVLYSIPKEYEEKGGCFPEVVQVYLWYLCMDRGMDYYIIVALIERESGYRWDRVGDNGNSKGYMQIYEKWHYDRMEAEGVTDLYNPYQNIRVGLNYLQEIQDEYLSGSGVNCVLMVYNMGETTAKKHWSNGTYSTEYSRAIVSRAQEIKQELQD